MSLSYSGPPVNEYDGATILAKSLKLQQVAHIYGVVGIPIVEVATAAQQNQIAFIAMRNEQAASYAASAAGYLTGYIGVSLSVSGPGVIHALAGLANAQQNAWPMLLIAGCIANRQAQMGAFQEAATVEMVRPFTKYAAKIDSLERIPFYIQQAIHIARAGRPGAVYLEIPADLVVQTIAKDKIDFGSQLQPLTRQLADPQGVSEAISLLRTAQHPLIIVGKGCAYSRSEIEILHLVESTSIPFLPTPMGKGTIPDDHPLCVSAARTYALAHADVILLVGARLNWILHFGEEPRYQPHVKFIQIDIQPEEMHKNKMIHIPLVGDAKSILQQCIQEFKQQTSKSTSTSSVPSSSSSSSPTSSSSPSSSSSASLPSEQSGLSKWLNALHQDVVKNTKVMNQLMSNESVPMTYYRVFRSIRALIPKDAVIVSEGANTMDIGRTLLPNYYPRHRLDAGTFATMGVGPGFAIAAATCYPGKRIVAVEGDSAFGFSGLEFEVACRYKLPITFIIINNSGIYHGENTLPDDRLLQSPVTALTVAAKYEKLAEVCENDGAKGYLITTPAELDSKLTEALTAPFPTIVNILISPQQQRKQQKHGWLSDSKKTSKL